MADRHPDHNPETHHESRDVNVSAIIRFILGLVGLLVVSIFGLWGLFAYYQAHFAQPAPPFAGVDVDARKLPPEPRLQASPQIDLREMRAAEDQILNHYAWVDPDHGVVRIPIERAIDLMAQRGFPTRPQGGPIAAHNPLTATPTESALGPAIQQVGGPLAPVIHVPPVQPLEIHGTGDFAAGRQAGGPPTPIEDSPGVPTWSMVPAAPAAPAAAPVTRGRARSLPAPGATK